MLVSNGVYAVFMVMKVLFFDGGVGGGGYQLVAELDKTVNRGHQCNCVVVYMVGDSRVIIEERI